MAGSLFDSLFNGKLLDSVVEKGRKEVRGVIFQAVAEHALRPRIDYILEMIRKR